MAQRYPTCKNILSPNLNPYSEILGFNNSSRVVTQRFTANLINGSWQTFPIAFANDDVTIIFTNSTKGNWINVVGLIQDSSIAPPSNRYGFLPSISAQQPGGSFWNLGNTVTFEIVAIGMM